jgi:ABC-type Fe3+/spermidine/putrescine transport system ATPase subunit
VGLARAMVIEPRVLLMDEPLSNLDAKLRIEMRGEIRDIQRALGITTVYVTHDQEEALVISDRIAVMASGVVQQVGKPWEIYKDPRNTFVAAFVGNMNFIEGEIEDGGVRVGSHRFPVSRLGRAGGKVKISFRPEELLLISRDPVVLDEAAPLREAGRLSGTLIKSTFTGSLVSYAVDCGAGVTLTVERHKPASADILPVGSAVEVVVPPHAVLAFDAQTGDRV